MKIGKFFWLKPIILGIEILIVISLVGSIISLWKKKDIVGERGSALRKIEAEHERLVKKLAETQSQTFVEKEARNKLGLVKPGETVVLVGQGTPSSEKEQRASEAKVSTWKQWWKLFF